VGRSRSCFTTDGQSVCLGVEPTLGLVTRCYFMSENLSLKFAYLFLWDALSDERTGLQFVVQSLNGSSIYTHIPEVRSYFTTDGRSVSMPWCRAHSGSCSQLLSTVGMLLSEICRLVSVGRLLWRDGGSVICSAITQWPESRRTRNHTLLSYLKQSPFIVRTIRKTQIQFVTHGKHIVSPLQSPTG
jgi:hypothetical protein